MVAAIIVLGIFDMFDSIYGSLTGSVLGVYIVPRQMCVNVYTEVLTAAKTKLLSNGQLLSFIAREGLDHATKDGGLRRMSIRK